LIGVLMPLKLLIPQGKLKTKSSGQSEPSNREYGGHWEGAFGHIDGKKDNKGYLLVIGGAQMPQREETQQPAPCSQSEEKKSGWDTFISRIAFWKFMRRRAAERAFIQAVNDLHPQWAAKRAAKRANQA
jgi:hypothetical protein